MTAASRDTWNREQAVARVQAAVQALTGPIRVVERYHLDPKVADHADEHDRSPGVRQGKRTKGKGRTARTRIGTTPSLLDMLGRMLEPAVSGEATSSGGSFESSPPIALDAVDVYARIAVEAWSDLIQFRPELAIARQRAPFLLRLAELAESRAVLTRRADRMVVLLRRAYGEGALTLSRWTLRGEARAHLGTRAIVDLVIAQTRAADLQVQRRFDKLAAARSARDVRLAQQRSVEAELRAASDAPFSPYAAAVARDLDDIRQLVELLTEATSYVDAWQREIDTIVGTIAGCQSPTVPVLALNGIADQLNDGQLRRLDRDAARWVDQAQVAARYEPAPVTVGEPCPVCEQGNSVSIRGDRDTSTASCRACGAKFEHWQMGMFRRLISERQTIAQLATDNEITRKDEAIAVIRAGLDACGMSKAELARQVDVSETQIHRVLSPTRKWRPSESLLHRMAATIQACNQAALRCEACGHPLDEHDAEVPRSIPGMCDGYVPAPERAS